MFNDDFKQRLKELASELSTDMTEGVRLNQAKYTDIVSQKTVTAKGIRKGDVVGTELDLTKQVGVGRPNDALRQAKQIAKKLSESKKLDAAAKALAAEAKTEGLTLFEEVFNDADFVLSRAIRVENVLLSYIDGFQKDLGIDEQALVEALNAAENIDEAAKEAFKSLLVTCRKISSVTPSIRAKIEAAEDLVEGTAIAGNSVSKVIKASNEIVADFAKEFAKNYHIIANNLKIHE